MFASRLTLALSALVGTLVVLLPWLGGAAAGPLIARNFQAPFRNGHWSVIWTTMPQLVEPANLPNAPFNGSTGVFPGATLRQTLQLSRPASVLRLRISNRFGVSGLQISKVTIALPFNATAGQRAIQPNTLKEVTFNDGQPGILIPDMAQGVSDPIYFNVPKAQTSIAITIYLANGQDGFSITGHPGSRVDSWMTFGDQTAAANITGTQVASVAHWYFLTAVEAWLPHSERAFAIIGDSITDGRGSDTDKNNRWPDQLLARMQKSRSSLLTSISIANQAAGGNRVMLDGLGPSVLSRVERDVVAQAGVKYAMIFEGVNDIGVAATDAASQQAIGDTLIEAYKQVIARVHAVGIPIFGATITPFCAPPANASVSAYSDPTREKTRLRVNNWIRTSGRFDAVLDFDKVIRSPTNASVMQEKYNFGDYLHPNVAGYAAIAAAFPLDVFEDFEDGVAGFI